MALYQAVKIPVAAGQLAIEPGARVADVIEGRDALLRVFVDVGADWRPRTLTAHVTIRDGAAVESISDTKLLSTSSAEPDVESTFQVTLPAERVRSSARYAVEIKECEPASGIPVTPRVPVSGDNALGARHTGVLKVHILPIALGSRLPNTSDSGLEPYRKLLRAMYPITDVHFSVGSPIETPHPINWSTMLDQVRAQRQSDAPPDAVYYYGLVRPTDSLAEYCAYGCTTGMGYLAEATQPSARAAVGLGFGDEESTTTLAHELGHNHGRRHSPCSMGGSVKDVDASYPYEEGYVGVWGYDPRSHTLLHPWWATDVMGYCKYKWVSDYTYAALTERIALVNSAANVIEDEAPILGWRVALLEPNGARWGVPISPPTAPFGAPETAAVLDASGTVIERVTVYRTAVMDSQGFTVLVPPPRSGWSSVGIEGAAPLAFSAPVSVPAPRPR
ncbi:MAG TPA: M66 family metalloprotease [Polyangiaceae bacterium]